MLRVVGDDPEDQADVAALEIRPVALGFNAEHQSCRSASDSRSGHRQRRRSRRGSLRRRTNTPRRGDDVPALAARAPAAVGADVEAAPVVDRRRSSRAPWCRDAPQDQQRRREPPARSQQATVPAKTSSSYSPRFVRFRWSPEAFSNSDASAAHSILSTIYADLTEKCRLRNATLAHEVMRRQVNDLFEISARAGAWTLGFLWPAGDRRGASTVAAVAFALTEHRTGTNVEHCGVCYMWITAMPRDRSGGARRIGSISGCRDEWQSGLHGTIEAADKAADQ